MFGSVFSYFFSFAPCPAPTACASSTPSPTDSTIAPLPLKKKKTAISFNERFMAVRYEEGCYEKHIFMCLLVWKGPSNGHGGMVRRYGLELVSKPAVSLKESWGGGYRSKTTSWSEI